MTDSVEPMTTEELATLLTECVEAAARWDRKAVTVIVNRLFLDGTPHDGLRFTVSALNLLISLMSPEQQERAVVAGRAVSEGTMLPGELLFLRMLADMIEGNEELAMSRWAGALFGELVTRTGAPGFMMGTTVRQIAMLVVQSRAPYQ